MARRMRLGAMACNVSPVDNAGTPFLYRGAQELTMLVNKAADREWIPTDYPGIERSLFRNNATGGRSSVVRLVQGSRFPRHAHHGTEEVVVLAGLVSIGGVALAAGDYLFTSPGEEHDVVAIADAVIFVSSQKATPVIESGAERG